MELESRRYLKPRLKWRDYTRDVSGGRSAISLDLTLSSPRGLWEVHLRIPTEEIGEGLLDLRVECLVDFWSKGDFGAKTYMLEWFGISP